MPAGVARPRARRVRLRARLATRLAARPPARRQRHRHGCRSSSHSSPRRSPPISLALARDPETRAGTARRGRARRRDPTRAARGAALALDGRVDVLVLRLDRLERRGEPVQGHAARTFPDNPALPYMGERLARHEHRLRPGVHHRLGATRPRRRRSPTRSRPGRTRRWPPLPRSARRSWRGGSPGAARSPRRSSAGTRSSPSTSPAAGTTTPGSVH